MTTKFIGIKEFRKNLSKISKEAQEQNIHFIVMRHAQPVLRITPLSEEEGALEQVALDIAEAREEMERGESYSSDEVRKMLGI